jgi:hypothetical protein
MMPPETMQTAPDRSGDPLFGVLTGLYVALLVTPPVVFAVGRAVSRDPGVLYGTVLTTLAAVTVGSGVVATHRNGLARRLGATRLRWSLGVLPAGYALLGFASLETTGVAGLLQFFLGTAAMALGFILGVMTGTRYAGAVVDRAGRDCQFSAKWPRSARGRMVRLGGGLTAVAAVSLVAGLVLDRTALQFAGQVLFPAGVVLVTATEERTYAVSAAGLEAQAPVARWLLRWDRFDGASRTDDALVLHRQWRFDIRLAVADLDDPDRVERELARYLTAT